MWLDEMHWMFKSSELPNNMEIYVDSVLICVNFIWIISYKIQTNIKLNRNRNGKQRMISNILERFMSFDWEWGVEEDVHLNLSEERRIGLFMII